MAKQDKEPWQEANCYYTNGICIAKCEAACKCQNGELQLELRFRQIDLERLRK